MLVAVSVSLFATQTKAANGINRQINYQGKLLTSAGIAVSDGSYSIKFSLYAASSGGTPVWTAGGTVGSPTAVTVTVTSGLFTVLLGDTSAGQNALINIDWNSDTLYLGVTVGSDSEMTPRKRIAAVPQAFNAERLQGMYASGTVSGGQTLFTINQAENTGASSTRTALLIRSNGTSTVNDFLLRGLDDTGSQVFSINRQGSVTSSGNVAFAGTVTSTFAGSVAIAGAVSSTAGTIDSYFNIRGNTTLGDASTDTVTVNGRFNADLLSATDATYSLGALTNRWLTGFFTNVTSTNASSTFLYALNGTIPSLTTTNVTSTGSAAFTGSVTSTFAASLSVAGSVSSTSGIVDSYFNVRGNTILGDASTDTITANARFNADLLSATDATYSLGALTNRWLTGFFTNVTSTNATSTFLYALNATIPSLIATNVTSTNATTTSLYAANAIIPTLLATNATATTLFSTGAEFVNVSSTSVTSTSFASANGLSNVLSSASSLGITSSTLAGTSPTRIAVNDRYAFIVNTSTNVMTVVDIQNPNMRASYATTGVTPNSISLQGRYAYVGHSDGTLTIFDVTNPASDVTIAGRFTNILQATATIDVFVSGRYAYVLAVNKLSVLDVSNPSRVTFLGSVTTGLDSAESLYVQGRFAYVANSSDQKIRVYDVGNPFAISSIGNVATVAGVVKVFVQGTYAYVAGSTQFGVVSVASSSAPIVLGTVSVSGGRDVVVNGRYAYVTASDGLHVIDVSVPTAPVDRQTVAITNARGVAVRGRNAYVTDAETSNRLRIINLPTVETISVNAGQAMVGGLEVLTNGHVGNQLKVDGGLSVGRNGILSDGALAVAASDATSSITGNVLIGTSTRDIAINSGGFAMNGDDLFVAGSLASVSAIYTNSAFVASGTQVGDGFITANYTGNFIFNSTGGFITPSADQGVTLGAPTFRYNANLGDVTSTHATSTYLVGTNLAVVNSIDNTVRTTTALSVVTSTIVVTSQPRTPDSVFVAGRYAYVGTTNSDLIIYNLDNPSAPSSTGSVGIGTSALRDIAVAGRYAYVVDTGGNFLTVDISNPSAPSQTYSISGLDSPHSLALSGSYAYVTENGASSDLVVIDIGHATGPHMVGRLTGFNAPRDIAVQGRYGFVADTGGGKFRIVDLVVPSSPALGTSLTVADTPVALAVQGRYAYVGSAGTGQRLQIIDIANPSSPKILSSVSFGANVERSGVVVNGRYVYVTVNGSGLHVIDVQNPSSPVDVTTLSIANNFSGLFVSGRYAYFGNTSRNELVTADVTGMETNGLIAASAQLGSLQVLTNGQVMQNLNVGGGLEVGLGGLYVGGPSVITGSSSQPLLQVQNQSATVTASSWSAYIDKLLVGNNKDATGTGNYSMVLTYASSSSFGGLCIDDTATAPNCPTQVGASIMSDGSIISNAFDLAEVYAIRGDAAPGDVVTIDPTSSSTVMKSPGTLYDARLMGVISTRPGFVLGWSGGPAVALTGRAPTRVSPINGTIAPGDPLTSSAYPGVAMKATKPGMILGYALEATSATSTIEVFINPGYHAGSILNTDGTVARLTDDLVIASQATASANTPAIDSWGLTFRGSAWDGTTATTTDFRLMNDVISSTSSRFSLVDAQAHSLFSIDQAGTARVMGDLQVAGKLYPSARGSAQSSKYLFLDDTLGPTSTYMATNADGWQANDAYDFAERYYSPDALEPGDLVVASQRGQFHIQRSLEEKQMLMGIVSTKPAFVAGRPATSTYPVALAGRVPTKVSTVKGAIKAGDPLAASTIPGVAVKAVASGPIVGLALEDYEGDAIDKIEVFVNPGWWGGGKEIVKEPTSTVVAPTAPLRGFAVVASGAKLVRVSYPSLQTYPNAQVTPQGEVEGGWWTDHLSDTGFEIILKQAQTHDVTFAWRVEATGAGERTYLSNGTSVDVDPTTGVVIPNTQAPAETIATSTTPVVSPVEPPVTPPVASPPASSSTETVVEEGAAVSSSTFVL